MIGSIAIQEGTLIGHIRPVASIKGHLTGAQRLIGHFSMIKAYEDYTESYDIVPKIDQQVLQTFDKHMLNDVIVEGIPYYCVENEFNGETFIIGG